MTGKQAIEILTPLLREFRPRLNLEERKAALLGLQALRRLEYNREQVGIEYESLLPGETQE